ncbi:MAG: hypothetical protein AAF561_10770 [Planctomycetota bacterium]
MTEIRYATPADAEATLAFIAESGFTPRDRATWDGLAMGAVLAVHSSRIVGAIPFEPRQLAIDTDGRSISVVHQTCVAVAGAERGTGLGSRMQRFLADAPPAGVGFATVFREEPTSPAYRWYVRSGFEPAASIEAFLLDEPVADQGTASLRWLDVGDQAFTDAARRSDARSTPGRVTDRPLVDWLRVHPYRGRYRFRAAVSGDTVALVGIGKLHSDTERLELLAWQAPTLDSLSSLVRSIVGNAAEHGIRPVRWPLATSDRAAGVARSLGMRVHWQFDLLARRLADEAPSLPAPSDVRYAGVDYI